ncbi:Crp/Fnr family transcriptional regulator [Myxococcota bacterium]|nr:Crp/Fnr family transcriptional regulator [Myxococcota bacterium]MCZ7617566.1 Crp/Fnr family transcriptional regulator [Myxococcota bacterium]
MRSQRARSGSRLGSSAGPGPGEGSSTKDVQLADAEFFRALGPADLAEIQPRLIERSLVRQRVLFFAGDPAESLWVIQRGRVRLYESASNGRSMTLEDLESGEIFGALSALEETHYPVNAEVIESGLALCLPRALLLRLLADEPRLAIELLRVVSRRLRDAHRQLRSLAYDPAPMRLARALRRAVRDGQARVTRRELAEAAGTTVETAIRVLRRFENEGILRGEVGRLAVLDESALRRCAGESSEDPETDPK